MALSGSSKTTDHTLPIILIAAVVQGWVLYWLHLAIKDSHWPATQPAWLLALYAVAVFIPLTVEMLSQYARHRPAWLIVGSMSASFLYFGWHHGTNVMDRDTERFVSSGEWLPMAFVLGILWLLVLPFIQYRLAAGRWRAAYQSLFATAWRNKLTLAEAVLFTGLFWLLLFLWQALFGMLGIAFFKELFEEPLFVYPVTSVTFGCALYLIGSLERLSGILLEQLLNVLKWLAIVAGLILALFTVALAVELPGMVASGKRAISAAWLLWLVAVTVLLVNAAYRDGTTSTPYPKWLAIALRCVVPLTIVIVLTALYALYLRVDTYGFTIARVWACIVAAAACIYAAGYALAALRQGQWMAGIERVNVLTALFLIGVIALALTPVLSPYRIAANSQFLQAQKTPQAAPEENARSFSAHGTPLHYLKFSAGKYGTSRLSELANLQDHPRAAEIREDVAAMIAQQDPWQQPIPANPAKYLASMALYPAGKTIDADLMYRLETDLKSSDLRWPAMNSSTRLGGAFVDLNADQVDEFVLIAPPSVHAYRLQSGTWERIGMLSSSLAYEDDLSSLIESGDVRVREPVWRELEIGKHIFRMLDR